MNSDPNIDLTNYIGAILDNSSYDGRDARHMVIASLLNEVLNLAKPNNEKHYSLYELKPLLRSIVIIMEDRINLYKESECDNTDKIIIKKYEDIMSFFNNLIDNIS